MKKQTLSVLLLTAILIGGESAAGDTAPSPTPNFTPVPQPCMASSWNPELYSFYGDRQVIVQKLANIPAKLSDRRVFLQVTQGDSSADVKLYEQKNGTFTVTEWTTKQTSQLLARIDDAIVANKGVNCVGEQVKHVLTDELKGGKVSNAIPAPASPQAAFAHSVKEAKGEFIKTTVIILC